MKLTKYLVSGAAAIALGGTLSLAYAQTTTPGATSAPMAQQGDRAATTPTPGMTNNGTAATGTMNSQGTALTNRRADGTNRTNTNADGTARANMNSDGSTSTERVARADRG